MSMRYLLMALISVIPNIAAAAPPRMIGNLNVVDLCAAVEAQTLELEPIHDSIMYQYQTLLYRAANVKQSDSDGVVEEKVRIFMNAHMSDLLCNQVNFNPSNGNILKMAIARMADPFVDNVLVNWKVDLNQVDQVDGFTVLDYIEQRRDQYKPGEGDGYGRYYSRLRKAGALHRFEIQKTVANLPPVEGTTQVLARMEGKARAGDFYQAIRLATIYSDGRLINGPFQPDLSKARYWLEQAGNLAIAPTNSTKTYDAHWVGMVYGKINDREAELRWYRKAVELAGRQGKQSLLMGWFDANFELGKAYALGDGVPRSLDLALNYMTTATESPSNQEINGTRYSQRWMGYIYEQKGDLINAAKWYRSGRDPREWNYVLPGGSGKRVDDWLVAHGMPKCGETIYGSGTCK